jgi:hypothetical protein
MGIRGFRLSHKRGSSVLALALLATTAHADQWTFFHPEAVTQLSYRVVLVDTTGTGEAGMHEQYMCEVHAKRNDPSLGNFDFTEGYYPPTEKGRHAADKACSKWMDKAHKLILKAQGRGK